jgi:hypothetical protein
VDWQTIAAIATAVGTVIALGVAALAFRQANIANDQAHTARDQAASAWRAANAAEEQSKAANEQVALMRQQLAAEQADRDKNDAPTFTIKALGYTGRRDCEVEVRVDRSPGPIAVTTTGILVRPTNGGLSEVPLIPDGQVHIVVPGDKFAISIDLAGYTETVSVAFELASAERDGQRRWQAHRSVMVSGPPTVRFL